MKLNSLFTVYVDLYIWLIHFIYMKKTLLVESLFIYLLYESVWQKRITTITITLNKQPYGKRHRNEIEEASITRLENFVYSQAIEKESGENNEVQVLML